MEPEDDTTPQYAFIGRAPPFTGIYGRTVIHGRAGTETRVNV